MNGLNEKSIGDELELGKLFTTGSTTGSTVGVTGAISLNGLNEKSMGDELTLGIKSSIAIGSPGINGSKETCVLFGKFALNKSAKFLRDS
jgi:hypothetical protein